MRGIEKAVEPILGRGLVPLVVYCGLRFLAFSYERQGASSSQQSKDRKERER